MHILLAVNSVIPVRLYGGIERVVWDLGRELVRMGHQVTYLAHKGSTCPFAKVIYMRTLSNAVYQVPSDVDIVHFHFYHKDASDSKKPYLITVHENLLSQDYLDVNTNFLSENHAQRYGATSYVYNGLDWGNYKSLDFSKKRSYYHFLGDASWKVKNVKGAIRMIKEMPSSEKLHVLGGARFNFTMGWRFTFSSKIHFHEQVNDQEKEQLMTESKGCFFPVRWHEPFGLAIIESMYFGCPVYGTPYGSLPELVHPEVGFLAKSSKEILEAILSSSMAFSPKRIHHYAKDMFNSRKMATSYLQKYENVLNGVPLNSTPPQALHQQQSVLLPWE